MLWLRLLGGLAVESAGEPVGGSAAQPRRLALLAVIARSGARGVTREQLQTLLWPDLDDERARRVLTHALYALRRDLGAEDAITGVKDLRLNPETIGCDVVDFENAIAKGDPEHAAEKYGGPFLQGFRLPGSPEFERWAEDERTALAHKYLELLQKLGRDATRRADADAAVKWWRRAAAQDPLNARLTTELMHALVATGNVPAALKQAQIYQALVDEELSLPPDREVVMLAAKIREETTRAPLAAGPVQPSATDGESVAPVLPPVAKSFPDEREHARAQPRRRSGTLASLVVILIVAASIVTTIALRRGASQEGDQPVIVVGPIRDHRDPGVEGLGTVADLLATSLARVEGLRVISTARVYELLAQSGASLQQPSAGEIAAVARQAGASELIDGDVYELPAGGLRLDFRRTRLTTGELVGSHTMAGPDLFVLVDSGTIRLARDVGARHADGSIADVTTSSEVAYRFYEEGLRHYFRNDNSRAAVLFDAALREDSTFAMAALYGGMAQAETDAVRAMRLLGQARKLSTGVTDRERLSIQAAFALNVRDPAVLAIAETLAVRFPLEVEGHLYLGIATLMAGQTADAIAPLLNVIRLDSLAFSSQRLRCHACVALENLTFAYTAIDSTAAALREATRWTRLQPASARAWTKLSYHRVTTGQLESAREALRRAAQLDPGLESNPTFLANFWIRQDRPDSAEAHIRRMGEVGDANSRLDRLWFLTIALREQGRLGEALATARQARRIRGLPPDTLISETLLLEAQVLLDAGGARSAATMFDSLARMPAMQLSPSQHASQSAWALTHRASALFAAGDTAALAALADTIQRVGRKAVNRQLVHHYARGLILFARGNLGQAAEELQAALPTGLTRAQFHLAQVLLKAERPERAIPMLQAALRGGIEGGALYTTRTELHEALAHAWEAANRSDSAAVHYRIVARSWQNADARLRARHEAALRRLSALASRSH